MTYWLAG